MKLTARGAYVGLKGCIRGFDHGFGIGLPDSKSGDGGGVCSRRMGRLDVTMCWARPCPCLTSGRVYRTKERVLFADAKRAGNDICKADQFPARRQRRVDSPLGVEPPGASNDSLRSVALR